MSDNPIYDALIRLHGSPSPTLYDSIATRMANAFLTDDLLEAVLFKWAQEVDWDA